MIYETTLDLCGCLNNVLGINSYNMLTAWPLVDEVLYFTVPPGMHAVCFTLFESWLDPVIAYFNSALMLPLDGPVNKVLGVIIIRITLVHPSVHISCKQNSALTGLNEPILMKLFAVAENILRMCMKEDNPCRN